MLDEGCGCQECSGYKDEARAFEDEVHYLEGKVSSLECKLEEKEIECDQVTRNMAELAEYVQELETALAEAHLMSQDDGPTGLVGDPQ